MIVRRNLWKTRSIHGFEKHLLIDIETSRPTINRKHQLMIKIDPARSIYPRDAMGNRLVSGSQRMTSTLPPYYLPSYDLVKPRSPTWTIKMRTHLTSEVHPIGPNAGVCLTNQSHRSRQFAWTQIGRRFLDINQGLTVPFYDTRRYKQVGEPCSACNFQSLTRSK
jgi:hypothetical protein